jgi:hypothetical protein
MAGDQTLEQVTHFKCLACDVSYKYGNDVNRTVQIFQAISLCGEINTHLGIKQEKI